MKIKKEVTYRLLLAKRLLTPIISPPIGRLDNFTLGKHIISAHDAAELSIAAIACQHDLLPPATDSWNLFKYFNAIEKGNSSNTVEGKGFFKQLNDIRNGVKHSGNLPDYQQWHKVGQQTYEYVAGWCEKYLDVDYLTLDETELIADTNVKMIYQKAVELSSQGRYRETMEVLALALFALFKDNAAMRDLKVGVSDVRDAIRLASFGVNANDYLSLQEFLPKVYEAPESGFEFVWDQGKYGHPGNWRQNAAEFCLRIFIELTICIQETEWIPGAISFIALYRIKITAIEDGVKIWREVSKNRLGFDSEEETVIILSKDESIVATSLSKRESGWMSKKDVTNQVNVTFWNEEKLIFGYVHSDKVKVQCVPANSEFQRELFPELPVLDWDGKSKLD